MTRSHLAQRYDELPAASIADSVNEALSHHDAVVVMAPPGAGKSTLLPLTILENLDAKQVPIGGKKPKILMLEPRRLAARQIAERMATLLEESVGQTVGYRMRFDRCVSAQTRVEVVTEGILTRMLIHDPTLDNIDVVIFDEFHERSLNTDLDMALTRQVQQVIRPDLKIVIMSATIDAQGLAHILDAPIIEGQGRMFPVTTTYATEDPELSDVARFTAAATLKAFQEHEGDILVFLPGQSEIMRCAELLEGHLGDTKIYPLYGILPPQQQRDAIAPSPKGQRKVVIATPIAETSLTIEGVRVVIDSGLCRSLVYDQRTGLSHLETVSISKDMATQRMGRAGRVTEGYCHRLWTLAAERRMAEQRSPEILYADLSSLLLDIAAFGERDAMSLPWITPPPSYNMRQAQQLLEILGAMDTQGNITELGKKMAQLPCHPRIAKMILSAKRPSDKALACDLAALLEEKDPLADEGDIDISRRIIELRQRRLRGNLGRWSRIAQIAKEYRAMVHIDEDNGISNLHEAGILIANAYPERVGKSIDRIGRFRLACGDEVIVGHADQLSTYDYIAVASLHSRSGSLGQVFLASSVEVAELEEIASERDNLSWDSRQGCVVMQRERRIGQIVISSKPLQGAHREELIAAVCEAVKKDGLSMLSWDDDVSRLQQRVAKVAEWHPELGLPDLSTGTLMQTAEQWLPFYLDEGKKVRTSVSELKKINLREVLWSLIPYQLQLEVDRLAPSHIVMPTGHKIRIDYRAGASAPVVSVKLQECFGLYDTPCVDGGRQPVLMELLSPGFKPVQLTQDLRSFWATTYYEVRKELKRRYPKHAWPDV